MGRREWRESERAETTDQERPATSHMVMDMRERRLTAYSLSTRIPIKVGVHGTPPTGPRLLANLAALHGLGQLGSDLAATWRRPHNTGKHRLHICMPPNDRKWVTRAFNCKLAQRSDG